MAHGIASDWAAIRSPLGGRQKFKTQGVESGTPWESSGYSPSQVRREFGEKMETFCGVTMPMLE